MRILDQRGGSGDCERPRLGVSPASKARLERLVRKAPEVVVKVSGRTKNAGHLRAHLDYITRNGKLEMQTDYGPMKGKEAVGELHADWADSAEVTAQNKSLRKAPMSVNMVLSLPKGSDQEKFRDAVTDFVDRELRPRVDVVVCFHDDTAHPHAHVTVHGRDREGKTFNPRKPQLHEYREKFAACLRHRGLDAEATPRYARGVGMRDYPTALRRIEQRGEESRARQDMIRELRQDYDARKQNPGRDEHPWEQKMRAKHQAVRTAYATVARALANSPDARDRALSENVTRFLEAMPKDRPPTLRDRVYLGHEKRQAKDKETEPPERGRGAPER
ncbi:relaxase/mobilization nuclease domain-containing protein [Bradyrhizobium australafricanum]|uniref:relaxase/mobilization nuclease domain-containing protein n=1 Tax=Bradyrhizobium australafricanum TaxID=2821406 RepID=UPI001CE2DCCF|nr:relaxase/mobilization nuclease domain-containing protein [Bradyrhizobium australafricanum]MCA6105370.1 hypothetical protein [Bradyrhizobium australafricanum]